MAIEDRENQRVSSEPSDSSVGETPAQNAQALATDQSLSPEDKFFRAMTQMRDNLSGRFRVPNKAVEADGANSEKLKAMVEQQGVGIRPTSGGFVIKGQRKR